jgi:AcrR family transcriptional regulator
MALTSSDWLAEGLKLLGEEGPDALRIERLCDRLAVSKGSFYHHFGSRDGFVEALLDYWQARNTQAVIEAVASETDPRRRSDALSELVRNIDAKPELALRAWARLDTRVARALAKTDRERMAYLEQLIGTTLPHTPAAGRMAQLVYAHFVGCQALGSAISKSDWETMDVMLREMAEMWLNKLQTNKQGEQQ